MEYHIHSIQLYHSDSINHYTCNINRRGVAIIVVYYSVGLNWREEPAAGVMVITVYNHGYDKW